ncbi:MAG: TIGR02757 family protein [Cyclobacteriaceae bacterium]|nr:TIGR02757 family protein [Cyclobacteriaceae bacterium]
MTDSRRLKDYLDEKVRLYNQPGFIENDPISIPHLFSKKQDIEISGLFAAVLAWGRRSTIISKCRELMNLMDGVPHDFILHHQEADLRRFGSFCHRTFQPTDVLYFIDWLHHFYQTHDTLEVAFTAGNYQEEHTGPALVQFNERFFSLPHAPQRSRKHIPSPVRHSACKRLNMFLRWMVRDDGMGVDFGLWKQLGPHQLICPCDLHVDRVARKLGLISRKATDWQTAVELTENLRLFDAADPVKYDFALFGLGIEEKFY